MPGAGWVPCSCVLWPLLASLWACPAAVWAHPALPCAAPSSRGEEIKPPPHSLSEQKDNGPAPGTTTSHTHGWGGLELEGSAQAYLPTASIHDQISPQQCFGHMVCLRVPIAVVKHHDDKWGKGLFLLSAPSLREFREETQTGQEARQELIRRPRRALLTGWLSLSYSTQDHMPRVALSTVIWALPHQENSSKAC